MYTYICMYIQTSRHSCLSIFIKFMHMYTHYMHTYTHKYIQTYLEIPAWLIQTSRQSCLSTLINSCTHTHIDTYIHTDIHAHLLHIYIFTWKHACIHSCMFDYIHTYIWSEFCLSADWHSFLSAYMHAYICTCLSTSMHSFEFTVSRLSGISVYPELTYFWKSAISKKKPRNSKNLEIQKFWKFQKSEVLQITECGNYVCL